jgi:hypothetical protein
MRMPHLLWVIPDAHAPAPIDVRSAMAMRPR